MRVRDILRRGTNPCGWGGRAVYLGPVDVRLSCISDFDSDDQC